MGLSDYGGNMKITITYPNKETDNISKNFTESTGYIKNPTVEAAGPNGVCFPIDGTTEYGTAVSNGYAAYSFEAEESGTYELTFSGGNGTVDLTKDHETRLTLSGCVDDSTDSFYKYNNGILAWDVTVAEKVGDDYHAINGRVWVDSLSLETTKCFYGYLYSVSRDGYIWRLALNGIGPYTYSLYANSRGSINKATNASAYHSVHAPLDNYTSFTAYENLKDKYGNVDGIQVIGPDNPPTELDFACHMFINYPDLSIPDTIVPAAPSKMGTITDLSFDGRSEDKDDDDTNNNVSGYVGNGGYFKVTTEGVSSYRIIIDMSNMYAVDYHRENKNEQDNGCKGGDVHRDEICLSTPDDDSFIYYDESENRWYSIRTNVKADGTISTTGMGLNYAIMTLSSNAGLDSEWDRHPTTDANKLSTDMITREQLSSAPDGFKTLGEDFTTSDGKNYKCLGKIMLGNAAVDEQVDKIYWNGRDQYGRILPVGGYFGDTGLGRVYAQAKAGEIHFPMSDAETVKNGIGLLLMNPPPYISADDMVQRSSVYYNNLDKSLLRDKHYSTLPTSAKAGNLAWIWNLPSSSTNANAGEKVENASKLERTWVTKESEFKDCSIVGEQSYTKTYDGKYVPQKAGAITNNGVDHGVIDYWTHVVDTTEVPLEKPIVFNHSSTKKLISGFVFYDDNTKTTGAYNTLEQQDKQLAGATITAYYNDKLIYTTTSDTDGNYSIPIDLTELGESTSGKYEIKVVVQFGGNDNPLYKVTTAKGEQKYEDGMPNKSTFTVTIDTDSLLHEISAPNVGYTNERSETITVKKAWNPENLKNQSMQASFIAYGFTETYLKGLLSTNSITDDYLKTVANGIMKNESKYSDCINNAVYTSDPFTVDVALGSEAKVENLPAQAYTLSGGSATANGEKIFYVIVENLTGGDDGGSEVTPDIEKSSNEWTFTNKITLSTLVENVFWDKNENGIYDEDDEYINDAIINIAKNNSTTGNGYEDRFYDNTKFRYGPSYNVGGEIGEGDDFWKEISYDNNIITIQNDPSKINVSNKDGIMKLVGLEAGLYRVTVTVPTTTNYTAITNVADATDDVKALEKNTPDLNTYQENYSNKFVQFVRIGADGKTYEVNVAVGFKAKFDLSDLITVNKQLLYNDKAETHAIPSYDGGLSFTAELKRTNVTDGILRSGAVSIKQTGKEQVPFVPSTTDKKYILTFDRPGKYTYELTEKKGNRFAIKYDETKYTLEFDVQNVPKGDEKAPDVKVTETVTSSGSTEHATKVDGKYTFTLVNNYNAGDLIIKKNVVGQKYVSETKDKTFIFTVELNETSSTDSQINGTFPIEGAEDGKGSVKDSKVTFREGKATVQMTVAKDAENGTITIKGLPAGAYYTVKETGSDGLTNTTEVTEQSGSIVQGTSQTVTFYNSYAPSVVLTGKKTLTGPVTNETNKDFSFTVSKDISVSGNKAENKEPVSVKVEKSGTSYSGALEFDLGPFDDAGTYAYVIKEETGELPGTIKPAESVTEYKVSVNVTIGSDHALKTETTITKGTDNTVRTDAINFENVYTPTPVNFTLYLDKYITNQKPDKDYSYGFNFTLSGDTTDSLTLSFSDSEIEKSGSFDEITYTEAGIYNYTVTEEGSENKGFSEDEQTKNIVVTVSDEKGTLKVTEVTGIEEGTFTSGDTSATVKFTNEYKPIATTLSITGTKTISGRDWVDSIDNGNYSFTLSPVDGDAPKPTIGNDFAKTNSSGNGGKFTFGEITFDKAGDYEYTITESFTDEEVPGITITTDPKTITVKVIDNEGKLEVTSVDGAILTKATTESAANANVTFKNEYKAEPSDAVSVNISKTLTGPVIDSTNNKFSFKIEKVSVDGNAVPADYTHDDVDVTVGISGADGTEKSYSGTETVNLGTFDKVGTYVYEIKEATEKTDTISVDNSVYTVTVTVKDDYENGTFTAETVIEKGGVKQTDNTSVSFENKYKPESASDDIIIEKTLKTDAGTAIDFGADIFSFNASIAAGGGGTAGSATIEKSNITNDAEHKITIPVKFTRAGKYTVTVKETEPASRFKNGTITYDKGIITVEYTVVDNNGKLEVSKTVKKDGAVVEAPQFNNIYTPDPITQEITLTKKVLYGDLDLVQNYGEGDSAFTFNIQQKGGTFSTTAKNNAKGEINFGSVDFSNEGTYTFEAVENYDEATGYDTSHITADTNIITITYTVSCNSTTGKLEVKTTYDKSSEFTNEYTPVPCVLAVTNEIICADDDAIDTEKEFEYTITLTNDETIDNRPIRGTFNCKYGKINGIEDVEVDPDKPTSITFTNGVATVKLKHGQGILIEGIGDHVSYTVVQTPKDHYTTKVGTELTNEAKGSFDRSGSKDFRIIKFTNEISLTETKASVPDITKVIEGRDVKEADNNLFAFAAEISGKMGGAVFTFNGETKRTLYSTVSETDGVYKFDPIRFGEITFTKTGTYTVTVTENPPADPDKAKESGLIYDTDKIIKITYTVTVDKTTGALSVSEPVYDGALTFTNKYKPAATDEAPEITINKELEGAPYKADEFTFKFTVTGGVDDKFSKTLTASLPDSDNNLSAAITQDLETYPEAGEYVYKVSETKGTNESVTYDKAVYTVKVYVEDDTSGKLHIDKITVSKDSGDEEKIADNSITFINTLAKPVVSIEKEMMINNGTKTVATTEVYLDDEITYVITVTNTDEYSVAKNVVVTDKIPEGLTLVAGSITQGGTESGGTVTWELGDLGPEASKELTFTVKVPSVKTMTTWENTASLEYDNRPETAKTSSNRVIVQEYVPGINVEKTVSAADKDGTRISPLDGILYVKEGDKLNYSITVTNKGEGEARGIVVTDEITDGSTPENISDSGVFENGKITWNIESLAPDASKTVTFTVTVPEAEEGVIRRNTASATFANNPDGSTAVISSNETQVQQPVLEIKAEQSVEEGTFTDGELTAKAGDTVTYHINVTSTGEASARDIDITDILPKDEDFEIVEGSISDNGEYVYINKEGRIIWHIDALEAGETKTLSFQAKLPFKSSSWQNSASVEYNGMSESAQSEVEVKLNVKIDTGTLTVKKTVEVDDGYTMPTDPRFTFKVTFSEDADGNKPLEGTFSYTVNGAAGGSIESGGMIQLRDGESAEFADIPEGTYYTVTEVPERMPRYFSCKDKDTLTGTVVDDVATEFINVYPAGGLTISKTVKVDENTKQWIDENTEFYFKVTFIDEQTGSELSRYRAYPYHIGSSEDVAGTVRDGDIITLKHGESITISNIPSGIDYIVEEVDSKDNGAAPLDEKSGYKPEEQKISGVIPKGVDAKAEFVNTRLFSSLTVTNTVAVDEAAGQAPDESDEFVYTVTLSDTTFNGVIDGITFENGVADITLKHDEEITIKDIPYGTTYSVTEKDIPEGYTLNGEKTIEGTIASDNTEVTAEYIYTMLFGTLTVGKTVEPANGQTVDENAEFTFKVTFTDKHGEASAPDTFPCDETSDVTSVANDGTFTLRHGEEIKILNIPYGTEYTVEETDIPAGYVLSGDVTKTYGQDGTIGETKLDMQAMFTNIMEETDVTVEKTQSVNGGDQSTARQAVSAGDEVTYTITVANNSEGVAYGVTVEDSVPDGLTLDESSITENGVFADGKISWSFDTIAPESSVSVSFSVSVPEAEETTVWSNTAEVSYKASPADAASVSVTSNQVFISEDVTGAKVGSLVVSKLVTGTAGDPEAEFDFTVTLDDKAVNGLFGEMFFTDGVAKFKLSSGKSVTALNIPAYAHYTVTEESGDYEASFTGDNGVIPENDTVKAVFVNNLDEDEPVVPKGDIMISNTVTGTDADKNDVFTFTLTLDDNTISGVYGEIEFTDGVAEFTLNDGESITAAGLPAGTSYTLEETVDNGYTVSYTNESGTVPENDTAVVTVVNVKNETITPPPIDPSEPTPDPTGNLMISNIVTGTDANADDVFMFTLTLDDNTISGVYGDIEFTDGVAEFTLKGGESITAVGLPAGTGYTLEETVDNGYTVTYTNASGTIPEYETAVVSIVNVKNSEPLPPASSVGNLTVSNMITGDGSDPDKEFDFRVTLFSMARNAGAVIEDGTYGDMTFIGGIADFTLKSGESKTAVGLPEGLGYLVEELNYDDYEITSVGESGTIIAGKTSTAAFVNHRYRKPGNLMIRNEIDGNLADPEDEFEFTVTLTDVDGTELDGLYAYDGSYSGYIRSGDTIRLRGGEYIIIRDILEFTEYSVRETSKPFYHFTSTRANGSIIFNETIEAVFYNAKVTFPIPSDTTDTSVTDETTSPDETTAHDETTASDETTAPDESFGTETGETEGPVNTDTTSGSEDVTVPSETDDDSQAVDPNDENMPTGLGLGTASLFIAAAFALAAGTKRRKK